MQGASSRDGYYEALNSIDSVEPRSSAIHSLLCECRSTVLDSFTCVQDARSDTIAIRDLNRAQWSVLRSAEVRRLSDKQIETIPCKGIW